MSESLPRPPLHLGPSGRKLWRQVTRDYDMQDFQLAILETACTAADRLEAARLEIAEHGIVVQSPQGTKANPAVKIEVDSRRALIASLRELNLTEEYAEAPRPPMIANRYRLTGV